MRTARDETKRSKERYRRNLDERVRKQRTEVSMGSSLFVREDHKAEPEERKTWHQ